MLVMTVFITPATAQNIINDTVLVNTESQVTFRFSSKCGGEFKDGDGSYEAVSGGTNKTLLVKAMTKGAKDQAFIVTEGGRRHEFVLVYNDNITKLSVDWSNKGKLKDHVSDKQKRAEQDLVEAKQLFDGAQFAHALAKYERLYYDVEEAHRESINASRIECEKRIQESNANKFKMAIAKGDEYVAEKKYREANEQYAAAGAVRPNDAGLQNKVLKNTQVWFKTAALNASKAYDSTKYAAAVQYFEEAREASPKDYEQYCKKNHASAIIKYKEQAYKQWKTKGDKAFEVDELETAKQAYDSALLMKSADPYCDTRLKKIKSMMEEQAANKAKEKEYYACLSTAKNLASKGMTISDYDAAIAQYNKAAKLFANRKFPKERIQVLTRLRTNMAVRQL